MATSTQFPRHRPSPTCDRSSKRLGRIEPPLPDDPPPLEPPVEPEEPSEPDEFEFPCADDAYWDVFVPDDCDPLPEPGDFWIDEPEELTDHLSLTTTRCE